MAKYFMDCVFYIALIGIVFFLLGRLLPKGWFRYDQFPFRPFPFENPCFSSYPKPSIDFALVGFQGKCGAQPALSARRRSSWARHRRKTPLEGQRSGTPPMTV